MRFPSRTGRLFWLLFWLAVGPLVLIFPASAWLAWTLQPLQKVYLTTYAASSVGAGIPHSEMTIRWVMKTAPKRKPIPASAEDVIAGPDPKLPVNLSSEAIAEGWRGVAYSTPEKVPADSLAKGLRDYVYDGRPLTRSIDVDHPRSLAKFAGAGLSPGSSTYPLSGSGTKTKGNSAPASRFL